MSIIVFNINNQNIKVHKKELLQFLDPPNTTKTPKQKKTQFQLMLENYPNSNKTFR